jgi:hypothetical protein
MTAGDSRAYADCVVIRQDDTIVGEHRCRFGRGETPDPSLQDIETSNESWRFKNRQPHMAVALVAL